MTIDRWTTEEGSPWPLGVLYVPETRQYNFALYSKHASAVRLLLYSEDDCAAPMFILDLQWPINKSGRVWHCRVAESIVAKANYYAYQVDGPDEPDGGHRFDAQKILLDPYARAVHFPSAFSRSAACRPGANPGRAPVGLLKPEADDFQWRAASPPRHGQDAIIYELHVRGFTKRANSGVRPDRRGTFSGVVEKIPYLKELGVTTVELLPVFQFDPQEGNYWGYMPISFFALHGAYGGRCAARRSGWKLSGDQDETGHRCSSVGRA